MGRGVSAGAIYHPALSGWDTSPKMDEKQMKYMNHNSIKSRSEASKNGCYGQQCMAISLWGLFVAEVGFPGEYCNQIYIWSIKLFFFSKSIQGWLLPVEHQNIQLYSTTLLNKITRLYSWDDQITTDTNFHVVVGLPQYQHGQWLGLQAVALLEAAGDQVDETWPCEQQSSGPILSCVLNLLGRNWGLFVLFKLGRHNLHTFLCHTLQTWRLGNW